MRLLWVFLVALTAPCTAWAGAWPRGDGNVYVYTSVTGVPGEAVTAFQYGLPVSYEFSAYGEYGLNDRWTLGFDGLMDETPGGDTRIKLFATRALGPPGGHEWAVSTGLGWRMLDDGTEFATVHLGGHWGLGLPKGWLSADVWIESPLQSTAQSMAPPLNQPEWKADFTFGHRLNKRITLSAQLQNGQAAGGDPYVKLVPRIGYSWGDDARQQIELGYIHGIENESSRKWMLGLSHSF